MTLDEAIKHLEETLNNPNHEWNCAECRAEHEQLLAWLKELKALKENKGVWKLDSVGVYCSECKMHPDYSSSCGPNCGADMRKGGAE